VRGEAGGALAGGRRGLSTTYSTACMASKGPTPLLDSLQALQLYAFAPHVSFFRFWGRGVAYPVALDLLVLKDSLQSMCI
jgi:hypothetical protein